MYLFKQSIPSKFGNFKEGQKDSLKNVPEETRKSWEASGLIVHCPLPPLEEPPTLSPESAEDKVPRSGKPTQKGRTTYDQKGK